MLSFIIKLLLATLILWYLTVNEILDLNVLMGLDTRVMVQIMFVGLVVFFISMLLMTYRWFLILKGQTLKFNFNQLLSFMMISKFMMIVLPGLGEDLVRIGYLYDTMKARLPKITVATLMDRIVGFYALTFISGISAVYFLVNPFMLDQSLLRIIHWILAIFCAGTVCFGCLLIFNKSIYKFISAYDNWFVDKLKQLVEACSQLRKNLIFTFLISVLNHAIIIAFLFFITGVLNINISFKNHLLLDPIALVGNFLPITPGGIGVTESFLGFYTSKLTLKMVL